MNAPTKKGSPSVSVGDSSRVRGRSVRRGGRTPRWLTNLRFFRVERSDFAETDDLVNRKARKALEAGLRPIICVGEVLEERQLGREEAVVSASLTACLDGISSPGDLAIAYEPVWAIGTGLSATSEQAQAMASLIRRLLTDQFSEQGAASVPVLYGGSVTPNNISEFASQRDIDGALVGGASLNASQFADIVRITARIRSNR